MNYGLLYAMDGFLYRFVAPYALLDVTYEEEAWKYSGVSSFGMTDPEELGYFNRDLTECPVINQALIPDTFATPAETESLKVV